MIYYSLFSRNTRYISFLKMGQVKRRNSITNKSVIFRGHIMNNITSNLAGYCYRFPGEFFPNEILKFEAILFLRMSKFATMGALDNSWT